PEEGLVFFDGTTNGGAPQPVEEILLRNASAVRKEIICGPLGRPLLNVSMAVELVASGFQRGVENATACSSHFCVVRVDLDLEFGDRVKVRDKDRTVSHIRFRHSIEQIVIAPERATAQREQR